MTGAVLGDATRTTMRQTDDMAPSRTPVRSTGSSAAPRFRPIIALAQAAHLELLTPPEDHRSERIRPRPR